MTREIATALVAFAMCWSIGASAGCSFGDDCDCPAPVPNPDRQAPLPVTFKSYDDTGNDVPLPIMPVNATIEVLPETVFIRYEIEGEAFEIGYGVKRAGL